MLKMDALLHLMLEKGASDLHLCVGIPPEFRIAGELVQTDLDPLTPESAKELIYSILTKEQAETFDRDKEIDFSYALTGAGRFRINLYRQRGSPGMATRSISFDIPPMEDLGIPEIAKDFAARPNGLVLITGPVGAGKSTTLAAMVEHINNTRKARIITIEDPIEYLFKHKKSTIDQREVGQDTNSFKNALRHLFRQDPNIVLIGEIRDLESMQISLTLAETGHLILTTLHTSDAIHSISRIVDVFPPYQQNQIRLQLSMVLVGVIAQQLISSPASKLGRVLVTEVMNVISPIRNLIRENDLPQIYTAMQTGKKYNMHVMNQGLAEAYRQGTISYEEALRHSNNQEELIQLLSSVSGHDKKTR